MLQELIQVHFAPVINVLLLLVSLRTNVALKRGVVHRITLGCILLLALIVADSVEYWTATLPEPTTLRVAMSVLGYVLRPMVALVLSLIVYSGRTMWRRVLLQMPFLITMLTVISAFWTDIVFCYDANNDFVRGPLGYISHVCCYLYLFWLVHCSLHRLKVKNFAEAGVIWAVVMTCTAATVMETVWEFRGLLNTAIALSATFYYLYLYAMYFKKDVLTGARNRQSFYIEAEKCVSQLSAVVALDMNDLKTINDTQGHAEGDRALCTVVECVQKSLLRGCVLYRTGGDEFTILCVECAPKELDQMLSSIARSLEETPYRCAMGMVLCDGIKTLDEVWAEADRNMYAHKQEMKAKK